MMTLPAIPVSIDLEEYSSKCLCLVKDNLYGMTRFGTNIQVSEVRAVPEICCFTINVKHPLEIIHDEETVKGKATTGPQDIVVRDASEYRLEIQKRIDSEFRNQDTLDQLWQMVIESKYPALSDRTWIQSHSQNIHFSYDCPKCEAIGKMECPSCDGKREVCCGCDNGKVSKTVGKQTYYVTCSSCYGNGYNSCWICYGSGETTCDKCDGLKQLTDVSTIHSHTTPEFSATFGKDLPDFVEPCVRKAGLLNLRKLGSVQLLKSEINTVAPGVGVKYAAHIPFCEVLMCAENLPARWILAGEEPLIYDSDGILERLLSNELEHLFFNGTISPTGHQPNALTQFAKSRINQIIFEESARNKTPEQIVQLVSGSVSVNYVDRALNASGKILAPILNFLRGGVFAVPVVAFFAVEAFHATVNLIITMTSQWEAIFCLCLMGFSLLLGLVSGIVAHFQVNGWISMLGGKPLLKWAERRRWVFGPLSIMLVVFFSAHFPLVHFERNIVGEVTWESEFIWLQLNRGN